MSLVKVIHRRQESSDTLQSRITFHNSKYMHKLIFLPIALIAEIALINFCFAEHLPPAKDSIWTLRRCPSRMRGCPHCGSKPHRQTGQHVFGHQNTFLSLTLTFLNTFLPNTFLSLTCSLFDTGYPIWRTSPILFTYRHLWRHCYYKTLFSNLKLD